MNWELKHELCWAKTTKDGKPGINPLNHCINVGVVAEALLASTPPFLIKLLDKTNILSLIASHDVGKVSVGFQCKVPAWLDIFELRDIALQQRWMVKDRFETDHTLIGQDTVQRMLPEAASSGAWTQGTTGGHHGRPHNKMVQISSSGFGSGGGPEWEKERIRLTEDLIKIFGPLPDKEPLPEALWFVSGLLTTADWIASDDHHFPAEAAPYEVGGALETMESRRRLAREIVGRLEWGPLDLPSRTFNQLFDKPGEAPLQLRPLQKVAAKYITEPGLYILEGETGGGKTEAVMYPTYRLIAEGKARGFYFALPTQLTSDQIHLRIKNMLKFVDEQVRLSHSSSWCNAAEIPQVRQADGGLEKKAYDWFASSKRAMLDHFGVGTVDQALMGVISSKHFFLRQFALAGKVVILDEIHSYDLYTSHLIKKLIEALEKLHCTVIILSATMTSKLRSDLLGISENRLSKKYPLLSGRVNGRVFSRAIPTSRQKKIHVGFSGERIAIRRALKEAEAGNCVLIVRNTVDLAQETYRWVKANAQEDLLVGLLHSRYPKYIRNGQDGESKWTGLLGKDGKNRPNGCVLIGTQVLEQSLDIDADFLVTDLAPSDMLIQRLGREWRHKRKGRKCRKAECLIITPALLGNDFSHFSGLSSDKVIKALESHGRIYQPYLLCRSLQVWSKLKSFTSPKDVRRIMDDTYRVLEGESEMMQVLYARLVKRANEEIARAIKATNLQTLAEEDDDGRAFTRYEDRPTTDLLLCSNIQEGKDQVTITLLDGRVVTVLQPKEGLRKHELWNREAAMGFHLHTVRVPTWKFPNGVVPEPPLWLSSYFYGNAARAVFNPDGTSNFPLINWSPEEGIVLKAAEPENFF